MLLLDRRRSDIGRSSALTLASTKSLKFSLVHFGIGHLVPYSAVLKGYAHLTSVSVSLVAPLHLVHFVSPFYFYIKEISQPLYHCSSLHCQLFRYQKLLFF